MNWLFLLVPVDSIANCAYTCYTTIYSHIDNLQRDFFDQTDKILQVHSADEDGLNYHLVKDQ